MTDPLFFALLLTAVGLAACYLLARERFDRASAAIATLGIGAGSAVAWFATGSDDAAAPFRLAGAALVSYGWVRGTRDRSTRVRVAWAAGGTLAGVAAALVRLEPQPFAGGFSVADVLWSSRGGLLATSPAIYLSLIGLALLWRVDRVLTVVGAAVFVSTLLVVSAQASWWASAWPAPAPFIAVTPYFVCGAAALVDALARAAARRAIVAAGVLLAPLVVWNLTLMQAGADASFHLGEPMSFGETGAAQARALHRWIGHPPSMPANLAYAAANHVPPSAYDRLAPSRLFAGGESEGAIDIGERDEPYVGEGWHGAERDGDRSFRWATATVTVAVPMDHPAPTEVDVIVRPYQPSNRPPQALSLVVNGAVIGPETLTEGWQTATFRVPATAWRSGVNRLALAFAYDARPSEVGLPDGRTLAASVDAIDVRIAE